MPTSQESNIEDFAYDYLHAYYCVRHNTAGILIGKQETTKQHATADGLLALKKADNSLFVATLNTQLSEKIALLLTRYKKKGLSRFRYMTALGLVAFGVLAAKLTGLVAALYVLPFMAGIGGFILHSVLEKLYLKRKIAHLVGELKHTPANEQWLGISISSLVFRHNPLATHLIMTCQHRGIGLLTVGKRAKVVQLQEPRTVQPRRGDFLSYYTSETQIRQALLDNTILRVA
ncbi:hypothetical protein [Pontibacter liquoris]|uniref:hypothetical protein n=1 Tax=Pontibacter liquoris TaxID=2905677 RepID=UPI001FA79459|nr:hypothetical protein [Pontibacter liquoris]